MATYYKYVERDADNYVDWGAIGKSMSDMLLEKDKIRNEKRAALDEASRQFGEVLANAPQGEHKGAREAALEYANNAAQFMRMQDILLKSGQLDLKDYTIARQNILDDTDRAFKANEMYQKVYKEKMDRYKKNISQAYEVRSMDRVEGFGDFSKSGFWIDPTSGKVSVAMKELKNVNGQNVYVMADNPNQMTSIDAINGLILGQWDRYDVEGATTALAEMNGTYINSFVKSGSTYKVEDILQQPDYINAETNYINASLGGSDSFDRLSLLTDAMIQAPNGKQYRFTNDENDAKQNPEAILMKIDPASNQEIPQISDEQMKDSTEWMRDRARSKYKYEKSITQRQQRMTDVNAINAANAQKQQEMEAGSWNAILMAQTAQEKKNAAEAVLASPGAQARGLIGITIDDVSGTVSLTYADPAKNTTFDIAPNSVPISLEEWAKKGAEVHGVTDQQRAIKAGGFYGQQPSIDFKGVQAKRQGPTATAQTNVDPMQGYQSYVESQTSVIDQAFKEVEESAVTKIMKAFRNSGFKFEESGAGNNISVTSPDGVTEEFGLNESDDEIRTKEVERFKEFLVSGATEETAIKWQNSTTAGVGGKYNPKPG